MKPTVLTIFGLVIFTAAWAVAQSGAPSIQTTSPSPYLLLDTDPPASPQVQIEDRTPAVLIAPAPLPQMSPELTLQAYRDRVAQQSARLASYSASSLILAQLPETQQFGECDLQRFYSAPHTLEFKSVRFVGDGFVKSNVIIRLLQSEVDHIQKDDPTVTALSEDNYKFSYKGTMQMQNRLVQIFQLKPRKNHVGLFKGKIYLDAHTGSMVRAEGRVAKTPSLFIRKIEFVQDYRDVGGFTFPVHIHSEARARLVGRVVVDIYHYDYQSTATTRTAQLNTNP
ncbi:MAG: hypothetical protein ACRD3L_00745 [Terriglobales bacterium]